VALKVLRPELAAAVGPERFRREITIAAQLQHPHILPLLDSGEAPASVGSGTGPLWFTMPYVVGESLRQRLAAAHQLPLAEALAITREVAQALEYAHRQGVVHRDVKPENILLARDGGALLADFGLARDLAEVGETGASGGSGSRRLTESGLSVGTLEYMSPEQMTGQRDVDARTDVYALGCVLYEMLAGEPPFTGATPQALVARRLVERPLPVRAVRDRIPAGVERAIEIALARAPADRYQSAGAFGDALARAEQDADALGEIADPSVAPYPTRAGVSGETLARRDRAWLPVAGLIVLALAGTAYGVRVWLGRPRAVPQSSTVAVLPFENLGDSSTTYFTDGVTDEIRSKLAALPTLQVIARGSSSTYRHTTKPLQQVASELGVRYLLTGQVRWQQDSAGRRARVDPELVQVTPGRTPTVVWQRPFDISPGDVFGVQAEIATRVATALDVAMSAQQRRLLTQQPTANLAAYDAYLQGEAAERGSAFADAPSLQPIIADYALAVSRDSSFGLAWARLAHAQIFAYAFRPSPAAADAVRQAIERAQALAPTRPETQLALALYEGIIEHRRDQGRSTLEAALAQAPNNLELLSASVRMESDAGRWEVARVRAERAAALDPRSVGAAQTLAATLAIMRRFAEARVAIDRALALVPTDLSMIETKAEVSLAEGNLAAARAVMHDAYEVSDTSAVLAYFAQYDDLYWLLDRSEQRRALALPAAAFEDDSAAWAMVRAEIYWSRGDTAAARTYADIGRRLYTEALRAAPNDDQAHVDLGLMLAFLGRAREAAAEGRRGTALVPVESSGEYGAYDQQVLARIYVASGLYDQAAALLGPLLVAPGELTPAWLRIDPTWTALHSNSTFDSIAGEPTSGSRSPTTP
jgi:TolB-like protein